MFLSLGLFAVPVGKRVNAAIIADENKTEVEAEEYHIQPSEFYNCVAIGPYDVEINEEDQTVIIDAAYQNTYLDACPTEVNLPSVLKADGKEYKVIGISGGFSASGMKKLVIPEGVTSIGPEFCTGGGKLQEVSLPASLTQIDLPFMPFTISEKTKVTIKVDPENESFKMEDCNLMTKDGATILRSFASGEYVIPDGVKTIGEKSFYRNNVITKVEVSDGVTNIDKQAFSMCLGLKEVVMSDSVTSIGRTLFSNSTALEKVTLSKKLKSIPDLCFRYSGIKELVVPEGVTKIGKDAFLSCVHLEKLSLPSTITDLEKNPIQIANMGTLDAVPSLLPKYLTISSKNKKYSIVNGALLNKNKTKLLYMIAADDTFTVPSTVKTINKGAFSKQLQLKKVILSKNIVELPEEAFMFSSVETVVCTNKLKKIGQSAFSKKR